MSFARIPAHVVMVKAIHLMLIRRNGPISGPRRYVQWHARTEEVPILA